MKLRSDSLTDGAAIPTEFAFGKLGDPVALSDNRSPHLAWDDVPEGTLSFVITCVDPDVPSRPDDVNQAGRTVPAELPRVEFVHWLIADLPSDCRELAAGACSDGITPGGKRNPPGPTGAVQGLNDYTGWFNGDPEMGGDYLGYDGPCPPWNDSIVHHYHFRVYALDVAALGLEQGFAIDTLRRAIEGHVLGMAEIIGLYSLNRDVPA